MKSNETKYISPYIKLARRFSLATAAITSRKSEGELSLICLYQLLKIDLMLSSTSPYIFPIHQHNFLYI
jgi:hypothetical protein